MQQLMVHLCTDGMAAHLCPITVAPTVALVVPQVGVYVRLMQDQSHRVPAGLCGQVIRSIRQAHAHKKH